MRLRRFINVLHEAARQPYILQQLAAEARKAGSYEQFKNDYLIQLKHGLYWHWTDDPNFQIDPAKGPRDMSTVSTGQRTVGALMVTSDLDRWRDYGSRPYAALIDLSAMPREQYRQVARGFGNEFFLADPSTAKVVKVFPRKAALDYSRSQRRYLPQSEDQLRAFYQNQTGLAESFGGYSKGAFWVEPDGNIITVPQTAWYGRTVDYDHAAAIEPEYWKKFMHLPDSGGENADKNRFHATRRHRAEIIQGAVQRGMVRAEWIGPPGNRSLQVEGKTYDLVRKAVRALYDGEGDLYVEIADGNINDVVRQPDVRRFMAGRWSFPVRTNFRESFANSYAMYWVEPSTGKVETGFQDHGEFACNNLGFGDQEEYWLSQDLAEPNYDPDEEGAADAFRQKLESWSAQRLESGYSGDPSQYRDECIVDALKAGWVRAEYEGNNILDLEALTVPLAQAAAKLICRPNTSVIHLSVPPAAIPPRSAPGRRRARAPRSR